MNTMDWSVLLDPNGVTLIFPPSTVTALWPDLSKVRLSGQAAMKHYEPNESDIHETHSHDTKHKGTYLLNAALGTRGQFMIGTWFLQWNPTANDGLSPMILTLREFIVRNHFEALQLNESGSGSLYFSRQCFVLWPGVMNAVDCKSTLTQWLMGHVVA